MNTNSSINSPSSNITATSPTIMMVDIDHELIKKYMLHFKSKGFHFVPVIDPRTILQQIKSSSPDIILLEIHLSNIRGDNLIKVLRKQGINVPIVVISSQIDKQIILSLRDFNVSAFFVKPVAPKAVEAKLNAILSQKSAPGATSNKSAPLSTKTRNGTPSLLLISENETARKQPLSLIPKKFVDDNNLRVITRETVQVSIEIIKNTKNDIKIVFVDSTNESSILTYANLLKMVVSKLAIPVVFLSKKTSKQLEDSLIKIGFEHIISRETITDIDYLKMLTSIINRSQDTSHKNLTSQRHTLITDLKEVKKLPPLPEVFLKVEELSRNPLATSQEYSTVIELDPGITAHLLRLSNSTFFSFNRKINSVKDAITLIGIRELVSLVRMSCITGNLNVNPSVQAEVKKIWQHSATCGITAKILYEHTDICKMKGVAEELFIGGIIHDIGKIVLWKFFPQIYKPFIQDPSVGVFPDPDVEKNYIGLTHGDVGRFLADYWKLNDSLRDVMSYHHNPMLKPDSELVLMIHLADLISNSLSSDAPVDYSIELSPKIIAKTGYSNETFNELAHDLESEITKQADQAVHLITN